jgi:hypothetical protein
LNYYFSPGRWSDAHGFAQMTRFLPPRVREFFTECVSWAGGGDGAEESNIDTELSSKSIRRQTKDLWS